MNISVAALKKITDTFKNDKPLQTALHDELVIAEILKETDKINSFKLTEFYVSGTHIIGVWELKINKRKKHSIELRYDSEGNLSW